MKIDAHQHFWKYDPEIYSWLEGTIQKDFIPEDLEPVLRRNKIDACIAVQADQSEEETVKLLEYANTHSFVAGVVGWLDLRSDLLEERLDLYSRDSHFIGLRHTEWDKRGEFMEDVNFTKGIRSLGKFGLTYDILAFDYQLQPALDLVRRFPEQTFILDHMGKPTVSETPSKEWVDSIKGLGSSENIYCKISGLVSQSGPGWKPGNFDPYFEVITEAFSPDRLLFGSDWPVCLSQASYEQVYQLAQDYYRSFSDSEQEKIFGGNAITCYNLQEIKI